MKLAQESLILVRIGVICDNIGQAIHATFALELNNLQNDKDSISDRSQ